MNAKVKGQTESKPEPADTSEAPPAAAEWAPLEKLKGWDKNPRKKNIEQVIRVYRSIKRFGWGRTLVARRDDGELIVGHNASAAAWRLIKEWPKVPADKRAQWHAEAQRTAKTGLVPVRFKDDLNHKDSHDLAVADNRHGEFGEWDTDLLGEHLEETTFGEARLLGWEGEDLAKALGWDPDEDDEAGGGDGGEKLGSGLTYSVVVECTDEAHQAELLERLEAEGLSCKPLVT